MDWICGMARSERRRTMRVQQRRCTHWTSFGDCVRARRADAVGKWGESAVNVERRRVGDARAARGTRTMQAKAAATHSSRRSETQ